MNQELKIEAGDNQKMVFEHMQQADYILILLTLVGAVIFGFIYAYTVDEKHSMFIAEGLVMVIGSFLFCAAYGVLALILSRRIRSNREFRGILSIPLLIAALYVLIDFIQIGANFIIKSGE